VLALTIRLIASLAVVVGLMLLLARFTGRRMRGTRGSLVQVVHRQPLTRTSSVSVVTVGDRVLVLGTTEHQVSLLTELDPDVLLEDGLDGLDDLEGLDADLIALPTGECELLDSPEVRTRVTKSSHSTTGGEPKSHRAVRRTPENSALTGSILSPDTWRQAVAALGRRAS